MNLFMKAKQKEKEDAVMYIRERVRPDDCSDELWDWFNDYGIYKNGKNFKSRMKKNFKPEDID